MMMTNSQERSLLITSLVAHYVQYVSWTKRHWNPHGTIRAFYGALLDSATLDTVEDMYNRSHGS